MSPEKRDGVTESSDKLLAAKALRQEAEKRLAERERNAEAEDRNDMDKMSREELERELKLRRVEGELHGEALDKSRGETADALEKCTDLFDNSPTKYFNFSDDGTIQALNFAAAKLVGGKRDELVNTKFQPLLSVVDRARFEEYIKRVFGGWAAESFEVAISQAGCETVHIVVESVMSADGKLARANVFDVSERHKAEADRKLLAADLEIALQEVKLLSGLLPICLTCKKIRDDSGEWTEVEVYIANHSEATFSQGLCPNCFPEFIQ